MEYALLVALVIAVIVVLVATVGRQVFDLYRTVPTFCDDARQVAPRRIRRSARRRVRDRP